MMNGLEASTVSAPAGVPVVDHSGAGYLTACATTWPVDDGGCDTPALVEAAERETGLPLTGFHGCYDLGDHDRRLSAERCGSPARNRGAGT